MKRIINKSIILILVISTLLNVILPITSYAYTSLEEIQNGHAKPYKVTKSGWYEIEYIDDVYVYSDEKGWTAISDMATYGGTTYCYLQRGQLIYASNYIDEDDGTKYVAIDENTRIFSNIAPFGENYYNILKENKIYYKTLENSDGSIVTYVIVQPNGEDYSELAFGQNISDGTMPISERVASDKDKAEIQKQMEDEARQAYLNSLSEDSEEYIRYVLGATPYVASADGWHKIYTMEGHNLDKIYVDWVADDDGKEGWNPVSNCTMSDYFYDPEKGAMGYSGSDVVYLYLKKGEKFYQIDNIINNDTEVFAASSERNK